MKGIVKSRKLTQKQGSLLLEIDVITKEAKDGKPVETKPANCLLNEAQVKMLTALGESVPKPGASVEITWSISTVTGEVSDKWVEIAI